MALRNPYRPVHRPMRELQRVIRWKKAVIRQENPKMIDKQAKGDEKNDPGNHCAVVGADLDKPRFFCFDHARAGREVSRAKRTGKCSMS